MVYVIIVHFEVFPEAVDTMKSELTKYALAYRQDPETIDWHVMQDRTVPEKFTVVERYESERSLAIHRANPIFPSFWPAVNPLLAKPFDLSRHEEMAPFPSAKRE